MALFFSNMACDPGTWGEVYVCRDNTCVGVPRSKTNPLWRRYDDIESCSAKCGSSALEAPEEVESTPPIAVERGVALDAPRVDEEEQDGEKESPFGAVYVVARDCGSDDAWFRVRGISPQKYLGGSTGMSLFVTADRDVEGGEFILKTSSGALGLTAFDFSGDLCKASEEKQSDANHMRLIWLGMPCPVFAGNASILFDLYVDPVAVPKEMAHSTTTIVGFSNTGEEILCAEVITQGAPEVAVIM